MQQSIGNYAYSLDDRRWPAYDARYVLRRGRVWLWSGAELDPDLIEKMMRNTGATEAQIACMAGMVHDIRMRQT